MKSLHFSSPKDYLALLVRRKWWVLFPFLALSGAAILLTYVLPKMYVSQTLILIRPRDVPEEFVKDLIAGTTEQRLTAIQQTVLSRTNLVQILQEFEDQLPEYGKLNRDDQVLKLHSQIRVQFEAEKRGGPASITYFRLLYQNRNPELAQKIAAKLTSLFIEQDNRARETQVFGTTEFLAGELDKVSDQLQQSEEKLKDLKARRRNELPAQLETNLRTLDRLGLQKQANAEAVDRTATLRLSLERLISETDSVIPRQIPKAGIPLPRRAGPELQEYRQKKRELDQLSLKYTGNHPEVKAATLQLERLKNNIPPDDLPLIDQPENRTESEPVSDAPTMPNPAHQNMVAQLDQVTTEAAIRERERKLIDEDIERYSQRVLATPQSEQEIADVIRQNMDLNKQYDSLKTNLAQAKLAESLESRQKSSQFQLIDPANYPLTPTKPAKQAIALAGVAISLLIGIAIAVIVDIVNHKLWTQSEIEGLLGAAVLVEIPEIVTGADVAVARRKKVTFVASSVVGALAYGVVLYFLYLHQAGVLSELDPVLQRFYL